MKDQRLKDRVWRAFVGFDNIFTVQDHLREMSSEKRYVIMDRLDAAGYYAPAKAVE